MVETYRLLASRFGADLAHMIYNYAKPTCFAPYCIGLSGLFELAAQLPSSKRSTSMTARILREAIYGAAEGGYMQLVMHLFNRMILPSVDVMPVVRCLARHANCMPVIIAIIDPSAKTISTPEDAAQLAFIGLLYNDLTFARIFYDNKRVTVTDIVRIAQEWTPELSDARVGAVINRIRKLTSPSVAACAKTSK